MQLQIDTVGVGGNDRGDILAVVPDTHVWGREEAMSVWLGEGRDAADFPNPHLGILRMGSEPPDLNLAEEWTEPDTTPGADPGETVQVKPRLWFVDLDASPPNRLSPGQVNSLTRPGGEATAGRQRRDVIKRKDDGSSLPFRTDSDGNSTHRHGNTDPGPTGN